MKKSGLIPLVAALAMTSVVAFAQDSSVDHKGATGWGGAANDQKSQSQAPAQTSGQKVETHDEAKAKDQPAIATGEDLKGPPTQLAPSKTPE